MTKESRRVTTKTLKNDDECSLEFTFDQSIKMEEFPLYFNRN